jgi:hypothetical protein
MDERSIDLDRNLFAVAFSIFRGNLAPYSAAILIWLASTAVTRTIDAPVGLALLRMSLIVMVGHAAYRFLLSGGAVRGWRAVATADGRFPWRYAGVMVIILSPILVLGIVWNAPGTGIGPSSLGDIGLGIVMVVTYAALYILIGTALPAVAAHGRASLGEAVRRGWRNYRAIGRSLVFGVWLFRAASILVMILLSGVGVTTDFYVPGSDSFRPEAAVPMLLLMFSHVFAECLNATVLLRAYRRFR